MRKTVTVDYQLTILYYIDIDIDIYIYIYIYIGYIYNLYIYYINLLYGANDNVSVSLMGCIDPDVGQNKVQVLCHLQL